jgi:hypothetical protein
MKKEAMESELVRRKLHNMVQELKGNIRVFCRVRPVLPSDLTTYASSLSTSPSCQDSDGGSLDFEKAKEELQASFTFPDMRDHKEIVVQSSSSSATGQERKEVYNFNFDRVYISLPLSNHTSSHSYRFLNLNLHKQKFLKKFLNSLRVALTATTSASSRMVKLGLESHLRWRVAW